MSKRLPFTSSSVFYAPKKSLDKMYLRLSKAGATCISHVAAPSRTKFRLLASSSKIVTSINASISLKKNDSLILHIPSIQIPNKKTKR